MQLTIDIRESAIDKIMYLLDNLKSDVKIIKKTNTNSLDIEALSSDDKDYAHILEGRQEREHKPQNYGSMDDIDWN